MKPPLISMGLVQKNFPMDSPHNLYQTTTSVSVENVCVFWKQIASEKHHKTAFTPNTENP